MSLFSNKPETPTQRRFVMFITFLVLISFFLLPGCMEETKWQTQFVNEYGSYLPYIKYIASIIFFFFAVFCSTDIRKSYGRTQYLIPFIVGIYVIGSMEIDNIFTFEWALQTMGNFLVNMGLVFFGYCMLNTEKDFSMKENFKSWICCSKNNQKISK